MSLLGLRDHEQICYVVRFGLAPCPRGQPGVRTVILEREGDYGNVSLCVEHYGQEWQGSALLRNLDPELPD
jgi:hypothetical protein